MAIHNKESGYIEGDVRLKREPLDFDGQAGDIKLCISKEVGGTYTVLAALNSIFEMEAFDSNPIIIVIRGLRDKP